MNDIDERRLQDTGPEFCDPSREEGGAMQSVKVAAAEFLAYKRVAVTGVSRTPKDAREQHRVPALARPRL
jgi:hypothetical protein